MVKQQHSISSAVRLGLLVGIGLGVVALVLTALYDLGVLPGAVQAGEIVVALAAFAGAGFQGSRQTGRAKSGVVAGLIASVLPGVVIQGASVLVAVLSPATFARWFGYHDLTSGQIVTAAMVQGVLGLIVWALLGALLGMLGGLVGRKRAELQSA